MPILRRRSIVGHPLFFLILLFIVTPRGAAFFPPIPQIGLNTKIKSCHHSILICKGSKDDDDKSSASMGIVSTLTNAVNFFASDSDRDERVSKMEALNQGKEPPSSPEELKSRIRDDYVVNNYLWTGEVDTVCFENDCRFQDPTISFVGLDKFVTNVQNLRPIVESVTVKGGTKSDLLDIQLNEADGYIETRWRMLGSLVGLPWKPKIDVVGKTKFWYKQKTNESTSQYNEPTSQYKVYFYDECWEIPSMKALMQIITPGQ